MADEKPVEGAQPSDAPPAKSDFIWYLKNIGAAAGVLNDDGTVNVKKTRDWCLSGKIPAWQRDGTWQSAHSIIRQKLTSD